jgi:hypothetical protein
VSRPKIENHRGVHPVCMAVVDVAWGRGYTAFEERTYADGVRVQLFESNAGALYATARLAHRGMFAGYLTMRIGEGYTYSPAAVGAIARLFRQGFRTWNPRTLAYRRTTPTQPTKETSQ